MGASLSSGIYQYKVDGHLEEIDHCVAIANDIVMYGFKSDGSDHGKNSKTGNAKGKKKWVCASIPLNANFIKPM